MHIAYIYITYIHKKTEAVTYNSMLHEKDPLVRIININILATNHNEVYF